MPFVSPLVEVTFQDEGEQPIEFNDEILTIETKAAFRDGLPKIQKCYKFTELKERGWDLSISQARFVRSLIDATLADLLWRGCVYAKVGGSNELRQIFSQDVAEGLKQEDKFFGKQNWRDKTVLQLWTDHRANAPKFHVNMHTDDQGKTNRCQVTTVTWNEVHITAASQARFEGAHVVAGDEPATQPRAAAAAAAAAAPPNEGEPPQPRQRSAATLDEVPALALPTDDEVVESLPLPSFTGPIPAPAEGGVGGAMPSPAGSSLADSPGTTTLEEVSHGDYADDDPFPLFSEDDEEDARAPAASAAAAKTTRIDDDDPEPSGLRSAPLEDADAAEIDDEDGDYDQAPLRLEDYEEEHAPTATMNEPPTGERGAESIDKDEMVVAASSTLTDKDVEWIDKAIRSLEDDLGGKFPLESKEVLKICRYGIQALKGEDPNLCLEPPVKICGNLHGNFAAVRSAVGLGKENNKVLFLGGYGSGGDQPLHVICFLLLLRARYSRSYFLLRGCHEWSKNNGRMSCPERTLAQACAEHFGLDDGEEVWSSLNDVFKFMPHFAIVGKTLFCSYGGVVPQLDRVEVLDGETVVAQLLVRDLPSNDGEHHHDTAADETGERTGPSPSNDNSKYSRMVEAFLKKSNLVRVVQAHEHNPKWGCTFVPDTNVVALKPPESGKVNLMVVHSASYSSIVEETLLDLRGPLFVSDATCETRGLARQA